MKLLVVCLILSPVLLITTLSEVVAETCSAAVVHCKQQGIRHSDREEKCDAAGAQCIRTGTFFGPYTGRDARGIYEAVEDPSLVGIGLKRGNRVATGTLKLWNADRGFGFIADDSGGPDIFLHISALQSAGIDPDEIRKGDRLTFDVESTRDGKTKARNV